jgi:hypothetical protein
VKSEPRSSCTKLQEINFGCRSHIAQHSEKLPLNVLCVAIEGPWVLRLGRSPPQDDGDAAVAASASKPAATTERTIREEQNGTSSVPGLSGALFLLCSLGSAAASIFGHEDALGAQAVLREGGGRGLPHPQATALDPRPWGLTPKK